MNIKRSNALLLSSIGSCLMLSQATEVTKDTEKNEKPNVLFIIMDDMCDWVNYLGGHNQVHTPNLDRLADRGIVFSNAYTAVPLSNPSRTALLTGIQPFVSGVYNNSHEISNFPVANNSVFMPRHFKDNGYKTVISGKIFHTKPSAAVMNSMWDDMENIDGGYGPWIKNSTLPKELEAKWKDFEAWTGPDTDFPDVRNSRKIIDFLGQTHDKPFFAAMGFYRPHNPYTAPKRYFDLYDVNQIKLPNTKSDDLDDIPAYAINNFIKEREYNTLLNNTGDYAKQMVRAYLACVSFADDNIGKILDALDNSGYADNTMIVLVGDNGFHHGEKERWGKSALWREANHVPFMIIPPKNDERYAKETCDRTVSLIDIYPTLIELCGLTPVKNQLAGNSLIPLLENVKQTWDKPAISTFLPGNFVVHYNHWNYIKYRNNSHELYNIDEDEDEFTNLADKPEYKHIVDSLKQFLPKTWAGGTAKEPVKSISEDFSSEAWNEELIRLNPDYVRPSAGSAFTGINSESMYFEQYLMKGAIASVNGTPNCAIPDVTHGSGEVAIAFRFSNTAASSYLELPPMSNVGHISLHVRNGNTQNASSITLQIFDDENWTNIATLPVQPTNNFSSNSVDEIITYPINVNKEVKLRIHGGDRFIHLFRIDVEPYMVSGFLEINNGFNLIVDGKKIKTSKPVKIYFYDSMGLLVFKKHIDTEIEIPYNVKNGIYLAKSDYGVQKILLNN